MLAPTAPVVPTSPAPFAPKLVCGQGRFDMFPDYLRKIGGYGQEIVGKGAVGQLAFLFR
jgi:hypothetical protein